MTDETHPDRLSKVLAAETRIVLTDAQTAQAEAEWDEWNRQMALEASQRRLQRLQFVAAALVERVGISAQAAQEWLAAGLPEFDGRTPEQIVLDDEAMLDLMARVSQIVDYVVKATDMAPPSRLGLPVVIRTPDFSPDTSGDSAVLADMLRQAQARETPMPATTGRPRDEPDMPRLLHLLQERAAATQPTPEAARLWLNSTHPRLGRRPVDHVVDQRTLDEAMALLDRGRGRRTA